MIDTGHHRLSIGTISGVSANDRYLGDPVGSARPTNGRLRVGFRMPARREQSTWVRAEGPASESLRRTNPRDSGEELAVYGELVARRRW